MTGKKGLEKNIFSIDGHTNIHSLMALVRLLALQSVLQSNKGSQPGLQVAVIDVCDARFIPEVPGASLSGDIGHFIWLPGRSFTLAAGDRLSIRHAAGPRQKGQKTTQQRADLGRVFVS